MYAILAIYNPDARLFNCRVGSLVNLFVRIGVKGLGPTIAGMVAGTIQFVLLLPLQKYVSLGEKEVQKLP